MSKANLEKRLSDSSYVVAHGHALWVFGPPASGKTTISIAVKDLLEELDIPVVLFDGDVTREIVAEGVGRSIEDRKLITHRYCRLTSYLTGSKVIVILAAINHTNAQRAYARSNHPAGRFDLVWVNTDIRECIKRDPKGLYRRAKKELAEGGHPEVVGLDIPFEEPDDADVMIATTQESPEAAARKILDHLIETGAIEVALP